MRTLIFLLALTSAFFVPYSYSVELDLTSLVPPKSSGETIYDCVLDGKHNIGTEASITACYENRKDSIIAIYPSQGSDSDGNTCQTTISVSSSGPAYVDLLIVYQIQKPYGDGNICGNHSINPTLRIQNERETELRQCPPDGHPLHMYEYRENPSDDDFMCAKEKSYCPAPTDNDPFVFGTGQQTTHCFDNPDGSQCQIETDESGGYYIPVSYGSAEPVRCKKRENAPIDKTPEPEEKPAPAETDPDPEPDDLSALNKINDNLDAINENIVVASDSNDERLDRLADELQIGNELLGEIRDKPNTVSLDMGDFESTDNGLLQQIADNTGEMVGLLGDEGDGDGDGDGEPAPDCIGDICNFDSDQYYADADKEMSDWLNKKEDLKPEYEVESYINKFNGYVGSAFAGFTGSCVPFNLEVSLRGQPKKITVGQHCTYYDQYFKPVLEWFLWVLTFVALLVISSQSFRAFSSI